tara:strand:+ start:297 stop:464 length:168 start_codon:yes stop_codon:yes gene_type:complete
MDDRGTLDLTRKIEMLEKQKKYLQSTCRRAGKEINLLKDTVEKLENLLTVIKGKI